MEMKELDYFIAIAEEKSISKAAERLFMAQSSLSQFLSILENNVGSKLFIRTSRGVRLTQEGELMLQYAYKTLAEYRSVQNEIKDMKQLKSGRVMKFVMNDKCSAGTGKFLEVMTNRLGLTQKELSELASQGKDVTISSMCTVFAESEVISLIGKGTSREDIAYGVVESVAVKVAQLISQLGGNHYFLTGGLCEDEYVISRSSHALNAPVESMPLARYAGAIGVALLSGE